MKIKLLLLLFILSGNAYSHDYEKLWGTGQQNFINSLTSSDYILFNPEDKPEYKNRIISFFRIMGGDGARVSVLRIKGSPEIDYCFFNNMLYSVSEDWGHITSKNAKSIITKIENHYIKKSIDTKEETTVITFEKDKNKIIIYKKPVDDNFIKLRIFYYTNEIFNILLKD
ncbi:MAG TPA: hypothetical protein P5120_09775 [Spirochaetota bacterium]|nr:hypothetical protein [Spirochaetota bacterium]HPF05390.1 hypothetical protein [Spirochaetota bacterium]HPJ42347.1 hypothetical protein [Spirochaetota bacterium]HRX47796.1 hypothetical protein [Spirochaetota bacterium]